MKYIKLFSFVLIGFLMAECQPERYEEMKGGFKISLGEDVTVSVRSVPTELGKPATDNFSLKIVKENDGTILYDGAYRSEIIPASVGKYTVTAACGENPVLALDAPYYKGDSTGVEVKEGQTANITLRCKVANALASIAYAEGQQEKFKELFSTYGVEVKVGNNSVNISDGSKQSAYYQAGSIPTFTFKGVLKDNNQAVSKVIESEKLSAAAFEAGKHCILTLSLKPATSGAVITVEKVEVESVTITETIPVSWLPAPKISGTGFDDNKTLTVYETGESAHASIDFIVSQSLQDLSFSLDFGDINYQSLNGDYQLSSMTDSEKIALSDVGITIPIIGSNNPKLSFSEDFISHLLAVNSSIVYNRIVIHSVKANDRINADGSQTYTIAVHKPEFSISVLPGNVWTKEFTIEEFVVEEGKGSLEKLKGKLVYQYLDNGEWKDCNHQDTRQQIFAEHPGNRSFKVRALYRGALASNEVDVEMEAPKALPNGNMDAWTSTTRDVKYFWNTYKQPFFQPWDDSVEKWWDTNNIQTMPDRFDIVNSVNFASFPTTTYLESEENGQGKSAVLRTINWGRSNSSIASTGDNTRGILYVGTTSDDGSLLEGRPWSSRPTQISFNYKYSSYNNERFGVYVELLDENNTVIATGIYESVQGESKTEFTSQVIDIEYTYLESKPSIIKIQFCSVARNDEPSVQKNISVNVPEGSSNYYNIHGGSVLTIDDITLIYDK